MGIWTGVGKKMALDIRPLHPVFVAEVYGVDLRNAPDPGLTAQVDAAMNQYAVVVLRDQDIDDDQQYAFAKAFGPLEPNRATVDVYLHRLKHHEMADISNL